MKELKVLAIVLVLVGFTYWGIEPYAHTKLSPHTAAADYNFGAEDNTLNAHNVEKAQLALQTAQSSGDEKKIKSAKDDLNASETKAQKYKEFWEEIDKIDFSKGDVARGKELFATAACAGCHGMEADGMPAGMDAIAASNAYGVNPPDLSTAGAIYDPKFLAAVIKNPAIALKVDHKFDGETAFFPMTQFMGAGGDLNTELADLVAYMQDVSKKVNMGANEMERNMRVYKDACYRCHDLKYAKIMTDGNVTAVANYLGSTPPDLSMMIRAKGGEYLHKFINDTQKMLPGTAMPRVGLTEQAEEQVVAFLESVGDSKKAERQKLSVYIMIFFAVLAVFATLWKRKIWSNLH